MYRGILPQSDSDWGEFLYTFELGLFSCSLVTFLWSTRGERSFRQCASGVREAGGPVYLANKKKQKQKQRRRTSQEEGQAKKDKASTQDIWSSSTYLMSHHVVLFCSVPVCLVSLCLAPERMCPAFIFRPLCNKTRQKKSFQKQDQSTETKT